MTCAGRSAWTIELEAAGNKKIRQNADSKLGLSLYIYAVGAVLTAPVLETPMLTVIFSLAMIGVLGAGAVVLREYVTRPQDFKLYQPEQ